MSGSQQDNNWENNNGYDTSSNSFNDALSSTYNSSYDASTMNSQNEITTASDHSYYSYNDTITVIKETQHTWRESQQSSQENTNLISTQGSWTCTQPENQNWNYDMNCSQASGASTQSTYENSMLCQALNDWEERQVTDSQLVNNAYEWEQGR